MLKLEPIKIGKIELLPLFEGGKGIAVSNGVTAGAWSACGGVGTFSGASADYYDEDGNLVRYHYSGKTRRERHAQLIEQSIKGALAQARIAKSIAKNVWVNMNVLWEMGGCQIILEKTLERAKGMINGVTCGAGMPYNLASICAKFDVFYFPIVSSMRAFNVLWQRAYKNYSQWLGAVVYEDPWIAGGHNGLSSEEDPKIRQDPYHRLVKLRKCMNSLGLSSVPIVIAGGVWCLNEWKNYLDNPEIGPVAFQFGTRPLLTKESPISDEWKKRLVELKEGDVLLNQFSPTGFYSSGVYNNFLRKLDNRSKRQIAYKDVSESGFESIIHFGPRNRELFVSKEDELKAQAWIADGYDQIIKTPDGTIVFETKDEAAIIHQDQVNCMGCLSSCRFSNWSQEAESNGSIPDPRSFCIQKTLQDIAHAGSIDDNLMFAGANVFRFGQDPFYANGFIPTVQELVDRIKQGD